MGDITTKLADAYDKANHLDAQVYKGLHWLETHPRATNYEQMEIALRGLTVEAKRAHLSFVSLLAVYRSSHEARQRSA